MRRLLFALVLAACVPAAAAPSSPPTRTVTLSEADKADLARVNAYLNAITSMKSDFVQIGPNGEMDQGQLYVVKPGRFRFEYEPPSPLLVVSDGRTVAVSNSRMKTFDRYPLSSTPFDMLLGDDIDLTKGGSVMRIVREPGMLIIEARTSRNRTRPNISITFAEPQIELRQWTYIDDQGGSTTVALRNVQPGVALNNSLFVLRDMKKPVGVKARD